MSIKLEVTRKGINISHMADELNMHRSVLSRIVNGTQQYVSFETQAKIIEYIKKYRSDPEKQR